MSANTNGSHEHLNSESFNREMAEVLNNIQVGFFSRNVLEDKYISLTQACVEIYGYDKGDFLNNPGLWWDVIYPQDRSWVEKQSEPLLRGENCSMEYRIIHKDGNIRWVEVKAMPVMVEGRLIRVNGIVSNISERKHAEQRVKKEKEFSEGIIDSLPGLFYIFNTQGQYVYWNKNLERVSGYSKEEIPHLNPLDFFREEEKRPVAETIAAAFSTGRAFVEAPIVTKDKREIPYYFTGRTIMIDGEVHVAGMGIDISDKKETQERLQKQEEMLSHILNSVPHGIFWKDINSVYIGCNTVFANFNGFSRPELLIGKSDFDLPWRKEYAEKFRQNDLSLFRGEKSKIYYTEFCKTKNGEDFWIDVTLIPLKDSNDKIFGLLGIIKDITEVKKEQERQEKINADLVQKNIELKQFSYIVSHNLRSPISKILGLASLFEKEKEGNELNKELIDYVQQEVSNLDDIVKDLNTILGARETATNSASEEISFLDELKLVVQTLDTEIIENNVTIRTDFRTAEKVTSIKAYFYSILYNLISNAIKYRSPERPLVIELKSYNANEFVCLEVKDNGLGIDLAKFGHKIFGLYSRFHTVAAPGKGIGLTLVKSQIETLGGKVEVESEPGTGTTFKLYFPVSSS